MQGNGETNGRPQRVATTNPLKTRGWFRDKCRAFKFKLLGNSRIRLDYFQQKNIPSGDNSLHIIWHGQWNMHLTVAP